MPVERERGDGIGAAVGGVAVCVLVRHLSNGKCSPLGQSFEGRDNIMKGLLCSAAAALPSTCAFGL